MVFNIIIGLLVCGLWGGSAYLVVNKYFDNWLKASLEKEIIHQVLAGMTFWLFFLASGIPAIILGFLWTYFFLL